ncbi:MAG: RNA-directed DNA polymerase [Chloroflexi bacterium]|nr:RNA-directed DNA polymerase [Chloroflexota bacterium]
MPYEMHSVVQKAYLEVHEWLKNEKLRTHGYMDVFKPCPDKVDMVHVAAQFASYFATHHFKNKFAFEQIVASDSIVDQLRRNPKIVAIDIGCGGGAASAALVALILELQANGRLQQDINLTCIGVDPAINVLGVYNMLMNQVMNNLPASSITLTLRIVDKPVSESVTDLDQHMRNLLGKWRQPALTHVFLMQSNIVSPLDRLYVDQQKRHKRLTFLDVPTEAYLADSKFGSRESRSYRQLFGQLPIDYLYAVTVGTNEPKWDDCVSQMGSSIEIAFKGHSLTQMADSTHNVSFHNPEGSYWWNKNPRCRKAVPISFPVDVKMIQNTGLGGDLDWHCIIDIDNLRLAWARVRSIRIREAISDQIEIRLFERHLEDNLKRLQLQLKSYDKCVAMTDDRLSYEFPKREDSGRPYVLPRLEEDIVSVAVVQVLGRLAFGLQNTSFAYRPHDNFPRSTEHLYRSWFDAYRRFKDEVSIGVSLETNCKVLVTDIESYFTSIKQRRLVDTVVQELRTQSSRVKWLLERLFLVDLDGHACGRGLAQGAAGSGFYANAFLAPLDSKFGFSSVHYYRYMDDICLVIPKGVDLQGEKSQLDKSLNVLGLERNYDKTTPFDHSKSFRDYWDSNFQLDDISARFTKLTNCLWYANCDYRTEAMQSSNWWDVIDLYRKHLRSIDIYVEADRLSRKLHQYLSRRKRRNDQRSGLVEKLELPAMNSTEWARQFLNDNKGWDAKRVCVKAELDSKLRSAYDELLRVGSENVAHEKRRRELTSVVVFCANRLPRLGIAGAEDILTKILRDRPTTISQPGYILRSLADQGFSDKVLDLMKHYADSDFPAAPYYLALAIEAVCHLAVIENDAARWIMSLAVDTTQHAIVRLKATETLARSPLDIRMIPTEKILKVVKDETSTRLVKNYLLLLAKGGCDVGDIIDRSDYLIQTVRQVGESGRITELFKCIEPDIIRKRYYGWEYADDSTEYSVSGYY